MLNKDLKELKHNISSIKHPRINKILESDKIDIIINKIQNIYHNISSKLILKYNLEDELKQGKIFTILIALLFFITLIVITLLFTITLNSIIGLGLIFSFFRQIIFCFKWGYTIIKNKGKVIKKYLSNLFPNSKILKEDKVRKKIPLYEENILYQIEDFIEEINKNNIDTNIQKDIYIKLRDIINNLNYKNIDFKDEIHSLEYKQNIQKRLSNAYEIYYKYLYNKKRQEEFNVLKNDIQEQIIEQENKIYVKKRI